MSSFKQKVVVMAAFLGFLGSAGETWGVRKEDESAGEGSAPLRNLPAVFSTARIINATGHPMVVDSVQYCIRASDEAYEKSAFSANGRALRTTLQPDESLVVGLDNLLPLTRHHCNQVLATSVEIQVWTYRSQQERPFFPFLTQ